MAFGAHLLGQPAQKSRQRIPGLNPAQVRNKGILGNGLWAILSEIFWKVMEIIPMKCEWAQGPRKEVALSLAFHVSSQPGLSRTWPIFVTLGS